MAKTISTSCVLMILVLGAGASTAFGQTGAATFLEGMKLPPHLGVGVTVYTQDQDYELDRLEVGIPGFDPALTRGLAVTNKITTAHATFDYWALPFLDLSVLAGYITGHTDVAISRINIGIPLQDLRVEYSGTVYGAGFTLAAGSKQMFGTLTVQYTNTSLNVTDSSVTAWVVTPKVGWTFSKAAVFVGAEFQDPTEKHRGRYTIPGIGTFPFSATLKGKDRWNYHAGVTTGLAEHWVLTLEGGFAKRRSALAHIDYRW